MEEKLKRRASAGACALGKLCNRKGVECWWQPSMDRGTVRTEALLPLLLLLLFAGVLLLELLLVLLLLLLCCKRAPAAERQHRNSSAVPPSVPRSAERSSTD